MSASPPGSNSPPGVLVVDDDAGIRHAMARVLMAHGYTVHTAGTARAALDVMGEHDFAVVVTDLHLPHMSGMQVMLHVRQTLPMTPVVMVTGEPTLDSAMSAVEHGAFRYLKKPLNAQDIVETVKRAASAHQAHRRLSSHGGLTFQGFDVMERQFDCALSSLQMAYQPIISARSGAVVGHEALLRTDTQAPNEVLSHAERLGRTNELGGRIRRLCSDQPPVGSLFVNLHPWDLADPDLFDPDAPLTRLAGNIVLEVTERTALEQQGVASAIRRLRQMGFRIAIDDLGAGFSGLSQLVSIAPDIVKLDMSLIRDIDADPTRQRLVSTLCVLGSDLGFEIVAEGIETRAESETLQSIGVDYLQGYYFGRPVRA